MKSKKIAVILIAIAFVSVVIFSCFGIFSLKKVDVKFSVCAGTDTLEVQQTLDKFIGKNLLFLDVTEVVSSIKDKQYMEVLSVKKQFPNVLSMEIRERREVYYVGVNDKVYVANEDGFVLNSFNATDLNGARRDKIELNLSGLTIEKTEIGDYLKTSDDNLLKDVFEMAKSVNLTDCIKSISVKTDIEIKDVVFSTYTGVQIVVKEANVDGVAKVIEAFSAYDKNANDYEKTFKTILVFKEAEELGGQIRVDWVDEDPFND